MRALTRHTIPAGSESPLDRPVTQDRLARFYDQNVMGMNGF